MRSIFRYKPPTAYDEPLSTSASLPAALRSVETLGKKMDLATKWLRSDDAYFSAKEFKREVFPLFRSRFSFLNGAGMYDVEKSDLTKIWLENPNTEVHAEDFSQYVLPSIKEDWFKKTVVKAWVRNPNTEVSVAELSTYVLPLLRLDDSKFEIVQMWLPKQEEGVSAQDLVVNILPHFRNRFSQFSITKEWLGSPHTEVSAEGLKQHVLSHFQASSEKLALLREWLENPHTQISAEELSEHVLPMFLTSDDRIILAKAWFNRRGESSSLEMLQQTLCRVKAPRNQEVFISAWLESSPRATDISLMTLAEHVLPHLTDKHFALGVALKYLQPDATKEEKGIVRRLWAEMPYLTNFEATMLQSRGIITQDECVPMEHVCHFLESCVPPTGEPMQVLCFKGSAKEALPPQEKEKLQKEYHHLMAASNPSVKRVLAFFHNVLPTLDGEGKTLLEKHAHTLCQLFKQEKPSIATLFAREGGLDSFAHSCVAALDDGCVANIGTQLKFALYRALVVEPSAAMLLSCYVEHIVTPTFNQDDMLGTSAAGANMFGHSELKALQVSPVGLFNRLVQMFHSEEEKKLKAPSWETIRQKVGRQQEYQVLEQLQEKALQQDVSLDLTAARMAAYLTLREIPAMQANRLFRHYTREWEELLNKQPLQAADVHSHPLEHTRWQLFVAQTPEDNSPLLPRVA